MSVNLGTAATYAVLASTTITNVPTSATRLTGDVGLSPNTASSVTGFNTSTPPGAGTYTGTLNAGNAAASTALSDAQTAYVQCTGATTTNQLSASTYDVSNNLVLTAGVYGVGSSMLISTGSLTLSGNSSSVFIFKIGTTLTTASSTSVVLSGGVSAENVFWQVGSSATLGTNTDFEGTILADESVTANTGATSTGGLIALNAAVTLDDNTVSNAAVCYVKGTPILTRDGYKNIEDIVLGDEVYVFGDITEGENKQVINQSDGQTTRKVIFNGYFTRSNLNIESKPIVLKAGSLGENSPSRDVALSPGHGVIVNGKIILAINLVNNDTIYQSDDYKEVTYYHIELESHSVINAGGLLGETLNAHQHEFTPI